MLAVYTVALYRVEPGSIDPWEVLLYIWVLVSQVKLPARFYLCLFVGCGSNAGEVLATEWMLVIAVAVVARGYGYSSRALNSTIPLDVLVAYLTCYCDACTITT